MLVYANHFTVIGEERKEKIFSSIIGWLDQVAHRKFTIEELCREGDFREGNYQVRIYAADKEKPFLYVIALKHKDSKVGGRQWSTEISIKLEDDSASVSIILETDEISTQVKEIPSTTCPRLVSYLAENADFSTDTIGVKPRKIDNNDLKGLAYEIESAYRKTPIVLVHAGFGGYVLDIDWLQSQLFGLAQVIYVDENINTWEMAEVIRKYYAVWNGSIRIIWPYMQDKRFCYSKLITAAELAELQVKYDTGKKKLKALNRHVLSLITHRTNFPNKREHYSVDYVLSKKSKERINELRSQNISDKTYAEQVSYYMELFEESEKDNRKLEENLNSAQDAKKNAEDASIEYWEDKENAEAEIEAKKYEINSLKRQLSQKTEKGEINFSPEDFFPYLTGEKPLNPESCLELIKNVFPDKIVVLDSALQSAQKVANFKQSQKLMDMLIRLVRAHMEGGDTQLERVFGNKAYSAHESPTTKANHRCKNARIFFYKGQDITMRKHLKIGTAANTEETLRVYFHIDSSEKKVVIGHCGEHLPIISV